MNCWSYLKLFWRFIIDCLLKRKDKQTLERELILAITSDNEKIVEEDTEIIEGILRYRDTEVREILTPLPSMVSIPADWDIGEIVALISEKGFSKYPVYDEEPRNIIGILNVKDIIAFIGKEESFNLKQLLKPTYFIPQSKKISELLKEFKEKKERMAVVVDEFGEVSGLVTQTDIIEEILGEIVEESEIFDKEIIPDKKGFYEIEATYPLDELSEKLNYNFTTDEKIDTIAGYIIYKIGRIPEKNEVFLIDNRIEVKILDADERKIKKIMLRFL